MKSGSGISRRAFVAALPAAQLAAAAEARAPGTEVRLAQATSGGVDPGVLRAGIHVVDEDLTIVSDLMLLPGAVIRVSPGRRLVLNGDFLAPIAPVFQGGGLVDLNGGSAEAAYPEWWGARPDDGAFDSLPALEAAVAAHPEVRLAPRDYFISRTWRILRGHRRIQGGGSNWQGPGRGTRIVVTSDALDVVQVGPDEKPEDVNSFLQGVVIADLELSRSRPALPPSGRTFEAPAGLRVRHLLRCEFSRLSAREHAIGFALGGAVRTFFRDCHAFRSLNSRRPKEDVFHGFHFDGEAEIGLAGGNASVFLVDCSAGVGGGPPLVRSAGAFLDGAFADSFLINFETVTVGTGIQVIGLAASSNGGRRKTGNANLHIRMPILDQCLTTGIWISALSDYAMVDIHDPYVALAGGAATAIDLRDGQGQVSIVGGQLIGWGNFEAGGSAVGIAGRRCEGLSVSQVKLLGLRRPVELDRCVDFSLEAAINNPDQASEGAAVRVRDCERGWLRPRIKGKGAFAAALLLEGANERLSIDVTGVEPAAVRGGEAAFVRGAAGSARGQTIRVTGN